MDQPSKYVLSLDSLDLSCLPYQSRLTTNTTSLWSASVNAANDYFQFEIKPKTEQASDIDESIDDSLLDATCYICNLKVPIAYLTEHENSLKHQAYVKIADVVLNRARQHMFKRENRRYARKIDSMYFCGPCVTVVEANDKENHEKSKLHKRSVSLDRLLYELVSLYTDDDNFEVTHTVEDLVGTDSKIDDNGNDVDSEVDRNFENTVLISDVEASLNKHETEKRKERVKVDKDDIKVTPALEMVTIETLDGFEINISTDNFHGFMRIGKRHLQCKLCKMIVKNEEEHKTSKQHVDRILKPFKDKHCIRILDNSWSHCVICNEIIENSDVHALCNEMHEKLLQKALVVYKAPPNKFNILIENNTNPQSTTALDSSEYFCSACNIGMHINNIESHMNGTKHGMNLKSDFHYVMKQVEGIKDLICRVCHIHVADSATDVENHVKTPDHANNLREFLTNNYVRVQKNGFYCKPCDVKIPKKNQFYHIEKLSHGNNLVSFEANLGADSTSNDTKDESKSPDTEKTTEKVNSFYCHVCNVQIPNNPSNIESHNDGNKHRKNVANVMTEIESAIERVASSSVPYQMETTPNEKELRCIPCNVIVPNREGNISEHVNGSKHKNSEKKIFEDNGIVIKGNNYHCNVCHAFVLNEHQYIHINLPIHRALLNNLSQKQDITNTQKVPPKVEPKKVADTENLEITEVLPKNLPVSLYSVLKHHFGETDDPDIVKCRVCFIDIKHTIADILNHASEKVHMEGYKDLMSRNLIFESDGSTAFCGICNCLVPGKGEFHHVFGSRHADNFAKVIANENCDICNIDTDMAEHITTAEHILKLKQNQNILNHCEICNALIIKNETNFAQHSANCELMLKHNLVVKDKICFCITCDLYFARNLMEEHTQSSHHMLLFNMIT